MSLVELITIKDRTANKISLRTVTPKEQYANYDYVIEKHFWHPNPGGSTKGWNIEYDFKIFKNNIQHDFIEVGNWKIVNIRSTSQFSPVLLFDLEDPVGRYTKDGSFYYKSIERPGLGWPLSVAPSLTGIKVMLGIASEASAYLNWSSFLNSNAKQII
jgi:hypothetical protein